MLEAELMARDRWTRDDLLAYQRNAYAHWLCTR